MKKLIYLALLFLAFGCSDDCKDNKAADKEMYEGMLENDGLSPEQRNSLTKQFALAMAEYSC